MRTTVGELGMDTGNVKDNGAMRICIPYGLEHRCAMCGCSCMAQLVGPLDEAELRAVEAAREGLGASMPTGVNPIMKGVKPDGTCLHFLNFPQKRCVFLDGEHLCRIHGRYGAGQKPAACRRFPRIAIRTENEVRVGIKPYCYATHEAGVPARAPEDVLARYLADEEMRAVLDELVPSASYRPSVRTGDAQDMARADAQEAQILSWLGGDVSFAALMWGLVHGEPGGDGRLARPFVQDVSRALMGLAPVVDEVAAGLGNSAYAAHVHALSRALRLGVREVGLLDGPFWAYARYALFNAVFLRETSRFPDVSSGCLGFALGCLAACAEPEACDEHLTTWFRVMAQTKLFESLFPSPQAFAALMRHAG